MNVRIWDGLQKEERQAVRSTTSCSETTDLIPTLAGTSPPRDVTYRKSTASSKTSHVSMQNQEESSRLAAVPTRIFNVGGQKQEESSRLASRTEKNRQGWRSEPRRIFKIDGLHQEESSILVGWTKKNRQDCRSEPRRIVNDGEYNQGELPA